MGSRSALSPFARGRRRRHACAPAGAARTAVPHRQWLGAHLRLAFLIGAGGDGRNARVTGAGRPHDCAVAPRAGRRSRARARSSRVGRDHRGSQPRHARPARDHQRRPHRSRRRIRVKCRPFGTRSARRAPAGRLVCADPAALMNAAPNILLVSNGYGEVAIAGYIARALRARDAAARVDHFPLVGHADGGVGPQADMPSGGLVAYWNLGNLARDVGAGLIGLTLKQFAFLRAQKARDVVVAVGAVYCLASALTFARRPTVFVATAKSEHVAGHSKVEVAIARRAAAVFARDEATAHALAARGVPARYAGNLMMDGVAPSGVDLHARADALRVAVLPGSRADAPANAAAATRRLAMLAGRVAPRALQGFVSIAPGAGAAVLSAAVEKTAGVPLTPTGIAKGVVARAQAGPLEIDMVAGAFGDML